MQLSVTFPDSSFPDVVFTSTSCSLVKDAAEVAAAEWNVEADLLELSFAGQKLIKDSQLLSHGLGVGDQLEVSLMKLVSRRWLTDSTKMNSICLLYEKDDLISLDCQTFVVNNCLEFEGRLLPFKVENLSFCNPNRTMSIVGENFLSKSTIVKLSISALSSVVVIEEGFLEQCLTLTYIDLSGLHNVTSIGSNFLFGCKVLPAIDLSPLQSVTSIGSYFINSCDSLSELNLSGLNNVLSIGGYFLNNCPQVADLDLSCLCSLQYGIPPTSYNKMLRATTRILSNTVVAAVKNDEWHVRGGQGGTKTSLSSNTESGLERVNLMEMLSLKESVKIIVQKSHPAHKIIESSIEKAAVLNRKWTDESFHEGEEGNDNRVSTLEEEFKSYYKKTKSLNDPITLGLALDLVGVYLKNYRVAKASAVMDEAMPICRKKGSIWLIKGLNHTSTVRMKQQRHEEALVMLRELEQCIPYKPEESIELHDILYRNIGMALQALGNSEGALPYFLKCAELKGVATWWDRWDVGYCIASVAFTSNDAKLLRKAAKTISDAIPLHAHAEPGDFVMHAKINQALADCYLALATLDNSNVTIPSGSSSPSTCDDIHKQLASQTSITVLSESDDPSSLSKKEYLSFSTKHYKIAHKLFTDHCGHTNDLSGWCAAAVALSLVQQECWEEAIEYLIHAMYVYSKSDIPRLSQLVQNLDLLLQCHNQLQQPSLLRPLLPHLDGLVARIESPHLSDPDNHRKQINHTIAIIFMSSEVEEFIAKGSTLLQKSSL